MFVSSEDLPCSTVLKSSSARLCKRFGRYLLPNASYTASEYPFDVPSLEVLACSSKKSANISGVIRYICPLRTNSPDASSSSVACLTWNCFQPRKVARASVTSSPRSASGCRAEITCNSGRKLIASRLLTASNSSRNLSNTARLNSSTPASSLARTGFRRRIRPPITATSGISLDTETR